ncbi:MAG: hypothetical protein KC468_18655 [Myxococcales bacterium]|nr:hypothetical protein [Myxococcales bacterium]
MAKKATRILDELKCGRAWQDFRGKRWHSTRSLISIPVTRGYRLLLRDTETRLEPIGCVTHQRYDKLRGPRLA